jgi:undecaprenyl-diphosphatase
LLLGAMQGPAELLPVSSSGHLVLVPRLLGWSYAELEPEERKSFEVAVHAGSAAALALVLRRELRFGPRDAGLLALTFGPPAVAGLLAEGPIERRLGTTRGVALAQVAGGMALWLADRRGGTRRTADAGDHLAVGLAQVLSLAPGFSRGGAALTAARLRGLDRPAAVRLSLRAAFPVTLGAAALKGARALRGELAPDIRAPLAVGAGAAFAAGIASSRLVSRLENARSFAPLAAYRIALGSAVLGTLGLVAGPPNGTYS